MLVTILLDFYPLFCILSCFTLMCIVFVYKQSTIHMIYILILIINSTLVILIFVFDQSFIHDHGLQHRTTDHHNMWIQSSFFVSFNRNCGTFEFCFHCLKNLMWTNQCFQRNFYVSPYSCSSIDFFHHLPPLSVYLFWIKKLLGQWISHHNNIIFLEVHLQILFGLSFYETYFWLI